MFSTWYQILLFPPYAKRGAWRKHPPKHVGGAEGVGGYGGFVAKRGVGVGMVGRKGKI